MAKIATAIARGSVGEVARTLHAAVEEQLGPAQPALVVAFASTDQPLGELLPALAGGIRGALVLGASTAGEFTEREEGTGATSVFAIAGDYRVFAGMGVGLAADLEGTVAAALRDIPSAVEGYPCRTAILLVDGLAGVGEEVTLLVASALGPDVPIAGGMAGDDWKIRETQVGLGGRTASDALTLAVVFSKEPFGVGVSHGHRTAGQKLTITRSDRNVVREIDGRPAWDRWIEATSAMAREEGLDVGPLSTPGEVLQFFARFEAGVPTGRDFKIRTPLLKNPDGSMTFACGMPEGVVIELMRSSPDLQLTAAREAARRARAALGRRPVAGALVFECACRKLLLGKGFSAAPAAVAKELGGVPLAGFESYGEIALNIGDFSGFHNTTSVVLAFPAAVEAGTT